VRHRWDNEG